MMKLVTAIMLAAAPGAALAQAPTAPVLAGSRFEQVALTVTDLDAARLFYRDRLGLSLMFEAGGMLFFDVGGTRLMLARDPARGQARGLAQPPAGILYFHVDDFAAALRRLENMAVLVGSVETVQATPDGFLRLQQFKDPDGNMLAIMGFVPR